MLNFLQKKKPTYKIQVHIKKKRRKKYLEQIHDAYIVHFTRNGKVRAVQIDVGSYVSDKWSSKIESLPQYNDLHVGDCKLPLCNRRPRAMVHLCRAVSWL